MRQLCEVFIYNEKRVKAKSESINVQVQFIFEIYLI